ncbi:MAG: hypothetical protein HQ564_08910 [Candidatus Saganbacteria bacterium]|nr:hypothetical protein [Candidatus Saganbacteria bacterium]
MIFNKLVAVDLPALTDLETAEEILEEIGELGDKQAIVDYLRQVGVPMAKPLINKKVNASNLSDLLGLYFSQRGESNGIRADRMRQIGNIRLEVQRLIDRVDARKTSDYLNLIREEHGNDIADNVEHLGIVAARRTKNDSRTVGQFIESMALNWLLKYEAFKDITAREGFEPCTFFEKNDQSAVIGLSKNGSIIFITRDRRISYDRIKGRKDINIDKFDGIPGRIKENLEILKEARTSEVKTSALIFLAASADADDRSVGTVQGSSIIMFGEIDRVTEVK